MSGSEIISIVGGGWSVKTIDLERIPGFIIAVNDSAIHLPRVDMILSMDRLWTEHRFPILRDMYKEAWLRRSAVKNLDHKWPWLHIFDCDHETTEFSEDANWLNGTNSGLCAFNKAYQMRPRSIYLFGFDMKRGPKGEPYWFPPYPWRPEGGTSSTKYKEWSGQFADAAKKCSAAHISVINASFTSAIGMFPKTREFEKKKALAS